MRFRIKFTCTIDIACVTTLYYFKMIGLYKSLKVRWSEYCKTYIYMYNHFYFTDE